MQDNFVHAPSRSDVLTTALYHAYGETLPGDRALDDLMHVLNWVDLPKA